MIKKILLVCAGLAMFCWSYAQNPDPTVIAADGGTHSTATVTLEWTMGETFVESIHTENNLITEGFNQPRLEVSVVSRDFDKETSLPGDYEISVSPNPVHSILNVQVESTMVDEEIHVDLFNLTGELQLNSLKKQSLDAFTLNMAPLPSGMYLLRFVNSSGQEIKTFKVLKIN